MYRLMEKIMEDRETDIIKSRGSRVEEVELKIFKIKENGLTMGCEDGNGIAVSVSVNLLSYGVTQAFSVVMFGTIRKTEQG